MKRTLYRTLLVAGIALISFTNGNSANASMAVADYFGPFNNIGALNSATVSGFISSPTLGTNVVNQITGQLAQNSMVTFTYAFESALNPISILSAGGNYSYNTSEGLNTGLTTALSSGTAYSISQVQANTTSEPLAFSSANIHADNMGATAVITNSSAGVLNILSLFLGTVGAAGNYTVSYSVSQVPLPAALPLFGLGLGALALSRKRKNKKVAA